MAKIGRNWRYVLNLAVRVHSTDPFGLPARIYDFSDVHLGGKYATAHNKVPNTGYGMVCDYERTLARSETMHPDQKTQSETELEECKELIEQASLSEGALHLHAYSVRTTAAPAPPAQPVRSPPSLFSDMSIYDIGEQ
ncbi:hypothetical protein SEUCBS139899_007733 [Sporothrix eucalyptigena]